MKKAIFWDSDGTLLYGNESFKCSLIRAFEEFGYVLEEAAARSFMRSVCSWYVPERDHSDKNGEEWWEDLLREICRFCKEHEVAEQNIAPICNAFRKGVVTFEYEMYPDAKKVLQHFKAKGYENYIISNNFPELGEVFCRLGLDSEISGYILSASVGYEKPRKEIFEYALSLAGNPEVRYMIGDNPIADYQGGLDAGLIPVLVHNIKEGLVCCETLEDLIAMSSELDAKFTRMNRIDQAIFESEQEVANGAEAVDAEVVFAELEKKS